MRADLQLSGKALLELAAQLPDGKPVVRRRPMELPSDPNADPYAPAPDTTGDDIT